MIPLKLLLMHTMRSMVQNKLGETYMNERVYKTMSRIGGGTLAIGIIVLVTGVATGVMLIVQGARLIKQKYELTF